MARRKKHIPTYDYECSLTGEAFTVTRKTESTDDLVSIKGYYELNPDMDDRPEHILAAIKAEEEKPTAVNPVWEALVELSIKQAEEKEAKLSKQKEA